MTGFDPDDIEWDTCHTSDEYNEQLSERMGGFSLDEIESILREIYPERFV